MALGWSASLAGRWLDRRAVRIAGGLLVIAFGVMGLAKVSLMNHMTQFIDFCLSH